MRFLGADLPSALNVAPMEQAAPPAAHRAGHEERMRETALRFCAGVQLKFSAVMEAPAA